MEKTSFELKAGVNSYETGSDDGSLIRIEAGEVYTTANANDIAQLLQAEHVKKVETPEGARAGSRTQADDKAKGSK